MVYIVTALGRLLVDLFLQLFSLAKVTTLKQAHSSLLLPPLLLPASSDHCLLASITKTKIHLTEVKLVEVNVPVNEFRG